MLTFRNINLQQRIMVFIVFLTLIIVLQTSILFYYTLSNTIENQLEKRALHIASTVAETPEIIRAFDTERPWEIIQPIAERIRLETDAEYIVIGNKEGIRYSHPVPERLGKKMVGGDNDRALVNGESYTSKATGTLGPALRGKVPIYNDEGAIIGIVSVGFLLEDIAQLSTDYGSPIIPIAVIGLVIGILGSIYLSKSIKKLLFGLEPVEIASLYKERNAVIESVREGIIVVDRIGKIILANQAAYDILSLEKNQTVIGKSILSVIPHSTMLEVVETGEEQLDRQLQIGRKTVIANRLPVKVGKDVIGVVSSFRLKSEIDQLTEELSQVKQYTEALRAQTHEYNNLLYTLSGLIQLESYDEALELIHREAAGHQELVKLIMKKIRDPLLAGLLLGFYNRAKELKIEFIIDSSSQLQDLKGILDNSYFVSIVGNLITNAFEAVEHNGKQGKKVQFLVSDSGDELVIEVEDNGDGITGDIHEQIFNKGFTTKDGPNRGFGLAKVLELTEELGGYITIEKGDLGGALFIVSIPKSGGGGLHGTSH
ncbi:two-component system CitB family sensor kinase [Bacillus mesophilus]|uniref:histidine kinase n=1 Tax=Bacillus mesophilus TaxID=1808955 RepID=A0A6M0Q5U9_9BACI|nr:sensor histidine kinase [Bacillus mesophilus]MBM7660009.1 two-component system CitB family sensor kinase [Bacillus mesophilus]NEY70870.1 sensor histidine kinase [Bacillus mesophilus]